MCVWGMGVKKGEHLEQEYCVLFSGPEPHGRKSCRVPGQIPPLDNKDTHSRTTVLSVTQSDALGRGHTHLCAVIKHSKVRVKCYSHINAANLRSSPPPPICFFGKRSEKALCVLFTHTDVKGQFN